MVQNTLEETKKLVWPVIEKYLEDPLYPVQFQIPSGYRKEVDFFWKVNKEYPERKGKYMRPTFVLLIAEALGIKKSKVLNVAAAMQLSEDWILIHDDIIDNSDERRGKPCLHKIYGNEMAINAGDTLSMIMWKIITDLKSEKIKQEFYSILMRTILGQGVEQMWTDGTISKVNENDCFFIADGKSGYYSIAGPMRLGAIAANATRSQIDKITEFGLHLGRCFQLVDDILDIDQDRKEGKATLATQKGVGFTKKIASKEKDLAKEIFNKKLSFLSQEPARKQLVELTDFILERNY